MSETGSSTGDVQPDTPGALAKTGRPNGRSSVSVERRRELIAKWRFVDRLTERQIVARLAKLDPPILITRQQVNKDLNSLRSELRKQFRIGAFDARVKVAEIVSECEYVIQRSLRDAVRADDGKERALHRKVALDAAKQLTDLLQDTGLISTRDFQMPADEGAQKAERIPSGDELRRYFESVNVVEGELVSEAERAWLYGDAAVSKAAAEDDSGDASTGSPEGDVP